MKKLMVKDIMVPLEKYATIQEDRLLVDAIYELEKAQKAFEESPYVHRAVLVYDDTKKIVGKLSQWDVIKCLEPIDIFIIEFQKIHSLMNSIQIGTIDR